MSGLLGFVNREPIRDQRVAGWMDELIRNTDKLLSLPSTSGAGSEDMSQGASTSSLESEWTPPREAWIYTLWKSESIGMFSSVKVLLEAQNYRCFGCGIRVEKEYLKRVKYCDYYGKVFCQCCHQGARSVIPARILHTWNFNEFPVCDLALHFLSEVRDVPAIDVTTVAPKMVEKIRVLKHVITLREKLSYMWDFVKDCPDAENTETTNGHLRTLFTSLEQHLLLSQGLFSLSDLIRVHNKDMSSLLEPIACFAKCHIEACEHCRQFAATCVFCEDTNELLFPFQLEKVHKCASCASLSHIKCQAKFRRKVAYQSGCEISKFLTPLVPDTMPQMLLRRKCLEPFLLPARQSDALSSKPDPNVDVQELMKALKIVRKAKERNIDLTTSMESLAMAHLKPRHRRRFKSKSSVWRRLRWVLYFALWVIAVVYFLALINRTTVCPWISESKTTEF
ncbi:unnamed protein product [Heligmosomoides polygyrus]|uniref:DUF4206 domain-containing protein n=1 Tax=Heligmosomoides polygyrus TaxID=6339 RepID=A0A3P7YRB3_HELPZ|nr:unnamed protein product [Heligmosomoides polygyrus]